MDSSRESDSSLTTALAPAPTEVVRTDPKRWVLGELERIHDDAMAAWRSSLAPASRSPRHGAHLHLELATRANGVLRIVELLPPAIFTLYAQQPGDPVDQLRKLIGRIEGDVQRARAQKPAPSFLDLDLGENDPDDAETDDEW